MQKIVEIFKTVAFPKSNDADEEQCMDQQPVQSKETCVDDTKSKELKLLEETIYDVIRDVHDPEKPENLEELNVVTEDCVTVSTLNGGQLIVRVEFSPTVPHCSLAALIGLSLRKKMERCLPESEKYKIDIFIKEGKHETANEINKQINDKERIAAAMENPNLRELIEKCIAESEDTY